MNTDQELMLRRRSALGVGIRCEPILPGADIGQDLVLQQGANGLDFARVEGMDALSQDLTFAFTTLLGSDIFNTTFGFDGLNALAEETDPILMRERVRIAAIQVLRKDQRIQRILDVKLDNGQLEAPPPGSREMEVRVEFETIAGNRAVLDVGKVTSNG